MRFAPNSYGHSDNVLILWRKWMKVPSLKLDGGKNCHVGKAAMLVLGRVVFRLLRVITTNPAWGDERLAGFSVPSFLFGWLCQVDILIWIESQSFIRFFKILCWMNSTFFSNRKRGDIIEVNNCRPWKWNPWIFTSCQGVLSTSCHGVLNCSWC